MPAMKLYSGKPMTEPVEAQLCCCRTSHFGRNISGKCGFPQHGDRHRYNINLPGMLENKVLLMKNLVIYVSTWPFHSAALRLDTFLFSRIAPSSASTTAAPLFIFMYHPCLSHQSLRNIKFYCILNNTILCEHNFTIALLHFSFDSGVLRTENAVEFFFYTMKAMKCWT